MKEIEIYKTDAGQMLSRYLRVLLPNAGTGFLYKMLRKKNITLNGKKADGKEILQAGDKVSLFFSDDTFAKFSSGNGTDPSFPCAPDRSDRKIKEYRDAYWKLGSFCKEKGIRNGEGLFQIPVVYRDEHICILYKPAGILSQKAKDTDVSLNEWLIGYLLQDQSLSEEQLKTFKPSVCNRLDRNTDGLTLCGVSLQGSRFLSELLKNRDLQKYYLTHMYGRPETAFYAEGVLQKDKVHNRVSLKQVRKFPLDEESWVSQSKDLFSDHISKDQPPAEKEAYIATACRPISQQVTDQGRVITTAEILLLTGKSHQIRAHMSALGYPLVGDPKYGAALEGSKRSRQSLTAWRVLFPENLPAPFTYLSQKEFTADAYMEIQRP